MKLKIIALSSLLAVSNLAQAQIQQAVCTNSGKLINVTILTDKGKWVGASVRAASGKIEDISPQKKTMTGINYNFQFSADAREYRVSTWKDYKSGLMQGRLSDTGWRKCK